MEWSSPTVECARSGVRPFCQWRRTRLPIFAIFAASIDKDHNASAVEPSIMFGASPGYLMGRGALMGRGRGELIGTDDRMGRGFLIEAGGVTGRGPLKGASGGTGLFGPKKGMATVLNCWGIDR
jgi:hypothetical protein